MNKIYQKPFPGEKNAGFTLIELLVVVLIIGILSAVALPQYRMAVAKAKVSKCMALARSLAAAQERYRMANGEYTLHFADLDVEIPSGYRSISAPNGTWSEQANYPDFSIQPKSDGYYSYCIAQGIHYGYHLDFPVKTKRHICIARSGDAFGNRLCLSYGGTQETDNGTYAYYYW